MILSGIPLHQALNALAESSEEGEAEIYADLTAQLERGLSFSQALASYPEHFPRLLIASMRVGEQTGRLHRLLGHVGKLLERSEHLMGRMRAALVYPAALLILTVVIVLVVIFFVLPRQADFLNGMGAELPFVTRILVNVTDFLLHPVFLASLAIGVVVVLVALKKSAGSRTRDVLARHWHRWVLDIPGVGTVVRTADAIRLLRGLSALLEAGATLTWSLEHLKPALDNRELRDRLSQSLEEIQGGETPSNCFARYQVLPPLATGLFAIGEEEGSLDQSCRQAADMMERDLNHTLDTLVSLLEPAALLIMGVVVGFVVLSTALPTVHLMQNL
jgi:type II secretory pathway component PulF